MNADELTTEYEQHCTRREKHITRLIDASMRGDFSALVAWQKIEKARAHYQSRTDRYLLELAEHSTGKKRDRVQSLHDIRHALRCARLSGAPRKVIHNLADIVIALISIVRAAYGVKIEG